MRTSFDLTPLFRSTVGFDRLAELLDASFRGEDNGNAYPPYNIIKASDDDYRVQMAVAGFKPDEVSVILQDNVLTVSAKSAQTEDESGVNYLHRGIARRSFERKFNLAEHLKVTGATLADGLLTIDLVREIPESAKPRQIPVSYGETVSQPKISGKKAA